VTADPGRLAPNAHVFLLAAGLMAAGLAPAAAESAKTWFFATREACLAAGAFSARECANAFANARAQLRDRAPRFGSAAECRLRFRLCERGADAAPRESEALAYAAPEPAAVYTPMALGVEMIATARGAEAAPTLAIDSRSRLFPYYPVGRDYAARRAFERENEQAQDAARPAETQNAAILPPDHFEPFSSRKPVRGAVTFTASVLGSIDYGPADAAPRSETREQRRARLKSAPFIQ
jgi:uncharacterized protein YgiB involved in biofilm formation